jgi:ubiquinone/menaquinone biosynthesis C-methylase UbiE
VTGAERERTFYERQYRPLLAAPPEEQRVDRQVLLGNCVDPGHPFHERAELYRATVQALLEEPLAGLRVLDYGCGPADFGVWMATEGAEVTLLDISPTAIELGMLRARASGVGERVRGLAADASRLPQLETASFDLVFACAALHHTLKYAGAAEELARVVRTGGRLILCETWGENPALAAARRLRALVAREEQDQGEEIVLSRRQLRRLEPWFGEWRIETFHLLAMAKRLLRGRLGKAWARRTVQVLQKADRAVLGAVPALRWWCGEALIVAWRTAATGAGERAGVRPA